MFSESCHLCDIARVAIKNTFCKIRHLELVVLAHSEVGGPDADDGSVGDVSEPLDDQTGASHLGQPVVVGALGPVLGLVFPRDGKHSDFMALSVEVLKCQKLT